MDNCPCRLPAEWEPHEAVWLAWPHNASDWPGKFATIPWVYAEMVRKLTPGERVRILVQGPGHEARARRVLERSGADLGRVEFHHLPTNRAWTRDFLPAFVRRAGQAGTAAVLFGFTGWAKYPTHRQDALAAAEAARLAGVPAILPEYGGRRVVLEGGGIDVNGRGSLLVTEEWLLDPARQVRNPGFGRRDYEAVFREYLGAANTLWLGRGIAGDDTHGHVDDLCRFVSPDTVVLCVEQDPADVNYAALRENRERLDSLRLEDGSRIRVAELPMPAPLFFEGLRLPASYANFLIANRTVLVPTFNDPRDREALGILAGLFPDRSVVGIHAVDLVLGFGSIHCLTHEQAAGR